METKVGYAFNVPSAQVGLSFNREQTVSSSTAPEISETS